MRTLLTLVERHRRRARLSLLALVVTLLSCVVLVVAVRTRRVGAANAVPSENASTAQASVAPKPTAVTDLAPPPSTHVEALRAYAAAMQKLRDGEWPEKDFDHALDLDPDLAAAHLRQALATFSVFPIEAREHVRKAVVLRNVLSERDRKLLAAVQVWTQSQPSDSKVYAKQMVELSALYPQDAELAYETGGALGESGDDKAALAYYDRALAIDPAFGSAYAVKAWALAYLGDVQGAYTVVDECLRRVPNAGRCLGWRARLDAQEGNCARMEKDAQQLLARDPTSEQPYYLLAMASYAQHGSVETVGELLHQRVDRLPAAVRARTETARRYLLDALSGDFDDAVVRAKELDAIEDTGADRRRHVRAAFLQVLAHQEAGRTKEAAEVARTFLQRKDAWLDEPRGEDSAVLFDPTPRLMLAAREGRLLSLEDYERERTRWVESWLARILPSYRAFVWVHGYAAVAETRGDAEKALSELARFGAAPKFALLTSTDAMVGMTQFLAGKSEEARPTLLRATRSCEALESPFEHTRAHLALGQILAASGDKAGACAAYRVILMRWGKARPRSVSADKARAFAASLGCP